MEVEGIIQWDPERHGKIVLTRIRKAVISHKKMYRMRINRERNSSRQLAKQEASKNADISELPRMTSLQKTSGLLWPPCVADADIIFLPCGFFYLLSFFPRLISAIADWMSAILAQWCGLSANLGCRSEMCCMRLAENTRRKKSPKIRHLGAIAQLHRNKGTCWQLEKSS